MYHHEKEPYLREYCDDHWTWDQKEHKYHKGLLHDDNILRLDPLYIINNDNSVGVRGTQILNKGRRYYWEIKVIQHWDTFLGEIMMGIGTKNCPLDDLDTLMKGDIDHKSWLLSHLGSLWHNGCVDFYQMHFLDEKFTTVGLFFDGIKGTLSFYENGYYLGVAFTNLHLVEEDLYPIFVSSKPKLEMHLKLSKRECLDLQDRCKRVILKCIKDVRDIKKLKLPNVIKEYLTGEDRKKRIR